MLLFCIKCETIACHNTTINYTSMYTTTYNNNSKNSLVYNNYYHHQSA